MAMVHWPPPSMNKFACKLHGYIVYLTLFLSEVTSLREDHRIVGSLVGCLPRAPRQNVQLGLPLQLMPEETRLLIDRGI